MRAEAESSQGPSAYQANALPLGQTGYTSQNLQSYMWCGCSEIRFVRSPSLLPYVSKVLTEQSSVLSFAVGCEANTAACLWKALIMFGRGEGRDGEGAAILWSSRYTQAKKKKKQLQYKRSLIRTFQQQQNIK